MNGVHDLGGMHGFGPVAAEPDEPVFHADWERRAFGLTLAMGAWRRWNLDMSRSEREQMPPAEYLATSYYEHWLFGLERQLVQHGFVSPGELARVQRGEPTPGTGAIRKPERITTGCGKTCRTRLQSASRSIHVQVATENALYGASSSCEA